MDYNGYPIHINNFLPEKSWINLRTGKPIKNTKYLSRVKNKEYKVWPIVIFDGYNKCFYAREEVLKELVERQGDISSSESKGGV